MVEQKIQRIEYTSGDLVIMQDKQYTESNGGKYPLLCTVDKVLHTGDIVVVPLDQTFSCSKYGSSKIVTSVCSITPFYFQRDYPITEIKTGDTYYITRINTDERSLTKIVKEFSLTFKLDRMREPGKKVSYADLIKDYN